MLSFQISSLGTVAIDAPLVAGRKLPLHSRDSSYCITASTASEVESIMESLKRDGKLPVNLPAALKQKMQASLERYFGRISSDKIAQFTQKAAQVVQDALRTDEEERPGTERTVETGLNPATSRNALTEFVESATGDSVGGVMNVDFFLRIAREVVQGGVQFVSQNWDQTRVDEFPALELHRVFEREVPRGSEKDPAGPTNGWDDDDGRWPAACDEAEDGDAANVFKDTGRMVALKDSDVWQALGDGAGGYEDTLGNPFAPFAFNSGMDSDEVSRDDAEELGLLDEGEEAKPAKVDFNSLFDLPEDLEARHAAWQQSLQARHTASLPHRRIQTRHSLVSGAATAAVAGIEAGGATSSKGCLMAMIQGRLEDRLLVWGKANIPDDVLDPIEGRESEKHCTIYYGFNPDFDVAKLAALLRVTDYVKATLGNVSRFECDKYDVLKIDVISPDAESIHAAIDAAFPDDLSPSQHEYHAHCTLAYVQKGALLELDGRPDFAGDRFTVSSLLYSLPNSEGRQTLPLNNQTN